MSENSNGGNDHPPTIWDLEEDWIACPFCDSRDVERETHEIRNFEGDTPQEPHAEQYAIKCQTCDHTAVIAVRELHTDT
jgi:DNA-directed RNA polymerase subunit RPC12/RpoP